MKKNNKFYLEDILNAINWILNDYLANTTLEELQNTWRLLSEDERRNNEIKKVAQTLKSKYEA